MDASVLNIIDCLVGVNVLSKLRVSRQEAVA
jgi:hypothetical protein